MATNYENRDDRPKTVTMQDIAQVSGVSQSTVSRVLNDSITSVPIAADTRQPGARDGRAPRLSPEPARPWLRGAKTMLLGLIVRDIADLFFTTAVEAVSLSARERNYNVVLGSAHSRADEAIAFVPCSRRATATASCCSATCATNHVSSTTSPHRTCRSSPCGKAPRSSGVATINIDNRGGIASAIDHLAGLGHRRFGFIGGYPHGDIRERRAGFIEHLTALGMPPLDDHVHAALNNPAPAPKRSAT